jgi:hypothetical protein
MRPSNNKLGVASEADHPSKVAACEGDAAEEVVRYKKGKGCAWVEIPESRPGQQCRPVKK